MGFALSHDQKLLISTIRRFIESELRPLEDKVEETGELAPEDAARIFMCSKDLGSYAIASGSSDVDQVRDRSGAQANSSDHKSDQYRLDDARCLEVSPCGLR